MEKAMILFSRANLSHFSRRLSTLSVPLTAEHYKVNRGNYGKVIGLCTAIIRTAMIRLTILIFKNFKICLMGE